MSNMKQQLNPQPDKAPFFKNKKKVHPTKRVYFHATLNIVKVVDEYNNVLAEAESVNMTVTRNSNGRSKIGKVAVINAKGWDCVYYRYITDAQDLAMWIGAVRKAAKKNS